jgi:flagellar hook protein FlgE
VAGIVSGLFAGRSGIESHGVAIAVLADNIANSNTVGYKASRADFTDLLSQSLGGVGGGAVTGNGSTISSITPIFNQGTFEFTGRGLDVAIDGVGFFVLGNESGRFYARAGNFRVGTDGTLLNQNGLPVLGFPSDGSAGLQPLNVNAVSQANVLTRSAQVSGNLDASSPITAVPGAGSTFAELNNAAAFSTFVEVFDSLGASHTVTLFYFHTAASTWEVNAYVDGGEIAGGTAGIPSQIGTAELTFNNAGLRTAVGDPDMTANATWINGSAASDIDITFNPYTQFSAPSSVNSISQDGNGVGNIVSISVEADGTLFAQLDNGLTSSVGRLALATFANPEGLRRAGDSLYAETSATGEPVIGTPGSGRFGSTQSGALELSTADIADDFIKLISLQRGFQGSSRIISSIDDLLNEIINLA